VRGRFGVLSFFLVAGAGFVVVGLLALVSGWLGGSIGSLGGSITGSVFLMIGVIWVLVALGVRAMYAGMRRKAAAEKALFESGTKATAVVESVETTGTVLNGVNHQIILRLRVQPRFQPEFPYERRMFVPINSLPRPGDVIDVAYDPNDKSKIALATDWRSDTAGGRLLLVRRPGDPAARPAGWDTATVHDPEYAGGVTSQSDAERVLAQLERLQRLRQDGALTDAEFESQKAKILSGQDS